jgi:hypothetical protein
MPFKEKTPELGYLVKHTLLTVLPCKLKLGT